MPSTFDRIPFLAAGLLAASLALLPVHSANAQTTVTVTPSNQQGWLIGPFGVPPASGFVDGPGVPPSGTGSYATTISVPASKIILVRTDYHDLALSRLSALSYWTYIDPISTNSNNWYINLYLDADGDGTYETRLDYVPPPGDVVVGTWQFWDAFAGVWNSPGGPVTLADFLTANPNARVNAFNDPQGGAVRWNMGDTASGYVGFVGNLDAIRIAFDNFDDTFWDFELTTPPVTEIPTLSFPALLLFILGLGSAAIILSRRT